MKYQFRTTPYPHQRKALEFLLRNRGGGLQIPMRYGKTKIICDFTGAMYHLENVRRVLVITVTSGLGVWQDEIAKHYPYNFTVLDWNGEVLAERAGPDSMEPTQFLLVNYANVFDRLKTGGRSWCAVPRYILVKFKADVVVVDESHHIGNPSTESFKQIHRLGRRADYRVIMTGTMFHRKPFYTFGQMKFLDDGAAFGGSFTNFKKRIAIFGGFENYEVMAYRNLKWMIKEVKKQVLIEKPKKLLDPVVNVIHFNLEGANLEAYKRMKKDRVLEIGGEEVDAQIILTLALRLAQIEGGWVKLPSGKYKRVGDSKIKVCEDRLREYLEQGIEKAVVACRFIPELKDIATVAKKLGFKVILLHGGVPHTERTSRIRTFDRAKEPALFVSQIATGSQAINLSIADTMMFYSMSESYLIHHQFSSRIETFNDTRTLQYDFLVARKMIGDLILEALQLKQDVASHIVSNPRLVEKLTRVGE